MKRGFTLVEVIVAILVTAVVVTSVFAVAMSVKRGTAVSERRLAANNAGKHLLEKLKNYVTPELAHSGVPWPGPGVGSGWKLPEDNCGDCGGGCYALATGCEHNASALIPQMWRDPPYGMTMKYKVYDRGGCAPYPCATAQPQVSVKLDWDEPPE